jgi:hypothetical protein
MSAGCSHIRFEVRFVIHWGVSCVVLLLNTVCSSINIIDSCKYCIRVYRSLRLIISYLSRNLSTNTTKAVVVLVVCPSIYCYHCCVQLLKSGIISGDGNTADCMLCHGPNDLKEIAFKFDDCRGEDLERCQFSLVVSINPSHSLG